MILKPGLRQLLQFGNTHRRRRIFAPTSKSPDSSDIDSHAEPDIRNDGIQGGSPSYECSIIIGTAYEHSRFVFTALSFQFLRRGPLRLQALTARVAVNIPLGMSDTSSSATALPALDNTMGMLYLSALFAMGLWGAGTVQMYFYYTTYPTDSLWLKYLVAVTWCADTANQGLISQLVYTYLVTNFANPAYLSALQPTLLPMMFLTGIIALLAQTFFCWRIWRLSNGNLWLTGGTYIVCFASFVSTMVFYGMTADYNEFAQLIPLHPYMHALNVLSAASDVIIAIVLVHLLRKQRTGYHKTNTMINRLILFTLNTGGICGLCAILTLVFNIVYPDTYIYMLFYIIVCRVYLNSLLATLNSRETIRAIGNATIINSMPNFSNQDSISLSFVGANGHPELALSSSGTTENDRDSKTVGGSRTNDGLPESKMTMSAP